MNVRLLTLCSAIVASLLSALPAAAHDPAEFERQMTVLPVPKDCTQLADPHYSDDVTDPDIKVLKERCDAEKVGPESVEEKKPESAKGQ